MKDSISRLRREFPWEELRFSLWVPAYLACFALLERLPDRPYWATQLPLDDLIPFCAWFVLPYCTWYFLLLGTGAALLLANRRSAYRRYMLFLSGTFFVSAALWIVLPNGQDLRPENPSGLLVPLVEAIYRVDTNTDVFPSLHVVGAVGAAIAVRDAWGRTRRRVCKAVDALAALICLSTVFIKQHSVLDAAGGLAFSAAAWGLVYSPAARRGMVRLRRDSTRFREWLDAVRM